MYCEPFCGGASIFFAKEKVESNWLNDLDPDVVNCLEVIRDRVDDLVAALPTSATRELHGSFKTQRPTNRLARAVRWFYLNRTSYSGIVTPRSCHFSHVAGHVKYLAGKPAIAVYEWPPPQSSRPRRCCWNCGSPDHLARDCDDEFEDEWDDDER